MPTSRATRVTSDANDRSWSTIVLMVSLSSRISPFTSTVILRDKSPRATAVATSAMFRTWPVRLLAMKFTLSVRSFQVPATPGTCAWPPSLPSVPTSRATRVTSPANALSWSTMVLMVFFSSRISPFTSTVILRDKSPRATAVVTSAMFRTWPVRLPAIEFTESVRSFQVPATPGTLACPPSRPSVPTSRATRVTSPANRFSWSTIVFRVSLSCRISPRTSTVILRDKIAAGDRGCHFGDVTHLTGQVAGHEVHVVGEIFPGTADAGHLRLAAELAFGTDFAGHARHFAGERVELVHHRVDGVFEFENFAFHVDRDLARQVAAGHGGRDFGDVSHLRRQVSGHGVDGVGKILPRTGHAGHDRLSAKLSVGTDFAGHARHFRCERAQLIHHRVDGFFELQNFAAHVDRDLARKIAAGHGGRDFRDVADLAGQVAGHRVDGVGQVLPGAGDAGHLRLAAQFAVGAHFAGHARHFGGEHAELLNHRVDDVGGTQEFAFERTPVHVEPDGLSQISLRHSGDRARNFRVGRSRSSTRVLTDTSISPHAPRDS